MDPDEMTTAQLAALLDDIDAQRLEAIASAKARARPLRAALDKKLAQEELANRLRHVNSDRIEVLRARAGVAAVGTAAAPAK